MQQEHQVLLSLQQKRRVQMTCERVVVTKQAFDHNGNSHHRTYRNKLSCLCRYRRLVTILPQAETIAA